MPDTAQAVNGADHLLSAARELMAEVGYGTMSMRQLAARAGLQPGSLYHHVASKQDLLLDVLLDILARQLKAWQHGRFSRDLGGYLRFMLARQRLYPGEAALLRHEVRHVATAHRPWLEQAIAHSRAPLHQIIERGQRNGHFNLQPIAGVAEIIVTLVDTAGCIDHRATVQDHATTEAWIIRMSMALLGAQTPEART